MTESRTAHADDYEYTSLRAESHEELAELLNDAAEHCWEPVNYAIWSFGSGLDVNLEKGVHFVILRRDTAYYERRIAEVSEKLSHGEYSDDSDDAAWAERVVNRAREDGYID